MDRIRTVATFVAGVLVGGGAVYFSPPEGGEALTTGAGLATEGPPPSEGRTLPDGSAPPLPPLAGGVTAPGDAPPPVGSAPGGSVPGGPAPGGSAPGGPVPGGSAPGGAVAGQPEAPALDEVPAAPPGLAPAGGNRLEKHLRNGPTLWSNVKRAAEGSPDAGAKALAADVEAHIEGLPAIGEHMPPMQEIASYLASSRVLLDRLAAAGVDVSELSLQIDVLMRPPRGKIPGGPKSSPPS